MTTEPGPPRQPASPLVWQRQINAGSPVERHGWRITPQSESFSLHWMGGRAPFGSLRAGLVYNRPTGLLLEHKETSEFIPSPDVTRLAQISLWALALLFALLPWVVNGQRKTGNGKQGTENS